MKPIETFFTRVAAISLLSMACFSAAHAQDASAIDESIPCIKKSNIWSVDIVDNKNIVFQTGVNNYYLNTLPYACNGLRLNDSLSYQSSVNELCNVDVITVLDTAGPGFQSGPSCGLGKFDPINKDEIKSLKESLKAKSRS